MTLLAGCIFLAGCARFPFDHHSQASHSIKDDHAVERPVRKHRVATAPRRPLVRPKPAAIKTPSVASLPKAPQPPRQPPPLQSAARPAIAEPAPAPPTAPAAPSTAPPPAAPVATDRPAPTAPREAAPPTRRLPDAVDSATTLRLLDEGRSLLGEGKVVEARKRFTEAGPSAPALLALARTFDTHYLSGLPVSDGAPDMQRALTLYTRALERGAPEAAADLDRVKTTLGRSKTD